MGTWTGTPTLANADSPTACRNIMGFFKEQLERTGWVQTADTGQFNHTTFTAWNTNTGIVHGYWVYQLNDSQAGTKPVVMRVEWYNDATSSLAVRVMFGSASDGTGLILGSTMPSGQTSERVASGGVTNGGGWYVTTGTAYASWGDGYSIFTFPCTSGMTQGVVLFAFSREWNPATGAIGTTGNYSLTHQTGTSAVQPQSRVCFNRNTGGVSGANQLFAGRLPWADTSRQAAVNVDLMVHYDWYLGIGLVPGGATCSYISGEIPAGSTFSGKVLSGGSNRTWLAVGLSMAGQSTTATSIHLAILWE